jgi:hypothetical protein
MVRGGLRFMILGLAVLVMLCLVVLRLVVLRLVVLRLVHLLLRLRLRVWPGRLVLVGWLCSVIGGHRRPGHRLGVRHTLWGGVRLMGGRARVVGRLGVLRRVAVGVGA